MRKNKVFFGLLAGLLAMSMLFAGCDMIGGGGNGGGGGGNENGGGGGSNENGGGGNPGFSITATFPSTQNAGQNAALSLAPDAGVSSSWAARDAAATTTAIKGTLVDGDITFNMKGAYDATTNSYSASAVSTYIKYVVSGAVANTVKDSSMQVAINTRSGSTADWNPTQILTNNGTGSSAITIESASTAASESVNGTPATVEATDNKAEDTSAKEKAVPSGFQGTWYGTGDNAGLQFVFNAQSVQTYMWKGGKWVMAPESYSPNMAFLYQAYRDTDGSDSTTDKNLGSNVIVSAASYTVTNGGAPVFDKTVYLNMALVPDGDTLTIYEVNFADSVTQAKSNYVRQTQIDNVDTSLYVIELQKTAPTLTGDYDESQANPSSVDDSTFVTALLNVQNLPTTIPGDSTGTPGDGGSSAAGPGAQLYAYIVDDTVGNSYTIYQESALGQSFTWGGYRGRTANEIFLHLNKKPSSTTTYTVIIGIGNGAQPATYTYKYGEVKFSALTGTTIQYTTVGFTSSESPIVDWNSMTDVLVTQGTGRKPLSTGTLTINNLPEYDGTTVTAQYSTFYVVQGVLANSEDAKIWGNEPQVIGGGTVFESGPPAIEGGDAMEESGNTNWYTADNSGTFAVVFDVTEDVIREGLEYPDHENYQVYVNNVVFSNGSGTLDFKNAARLDASSDKIIKDALTIQNAPTNLAAVWVSGAGSDGRWKRLAFAEASVSVDSRTGVMTWMDAPLKSPVSLSWYANSDNTYPTDGKYTVEFWLKDNYLNYQNHTGSTSWSPDKTISNVTFAGGKATVNYTLTPGQADITITGIPDGASVYIVDPSSLPNSLITSTGTTINDNDKALFSDVFSKNPTKMIAVGSQSAADTAKIYFWDGSASITAGNYAVVVWPINSNTIYYQNSVSFAADGSTTATITYNGMTAVKISSAQSEGQKGDR